MDDFEGESIMEDGRLVGIKVIKGNNDPANTDKEDNAVDALAGATITGNGVTSMISESLSLYKDYLESVRSN
jgi:Na+-transporting NADH:ubiquinone oxidoreductase subunit C